MAVSAIAIAAGVIVVARVRHWARGDVGVGSMTFGDLKQMHARGELSDQEYQSVRQAMLARHRRSQATSDLGGVLPPVFLDSGDDDRGSPDADGAGGDADGAGGDGGGGD